MCAEPCRERKTAILKSSSAVQRADGVPNKSASCQVVDCLGPTAGTSLKAKPAGSYLSENEHPAIVICWLYIVAHILQEKYVIGTQSTQTIMASFSFFFLSWKLSTFVEGEGRSNCLLPHE